MAEEASLDELAALLDEDDADLISMATSQFSPPRSSRSDNTDPSQTLSANANSHRAANADAFGAALQVSTQKSEEDPTDSEIAALENKLKILRQNKLKKNQTGSGSEGGSSRPLAEVVGKISQPAAPNRIQLLADIPSALPVIATLDHKRDEGKQLEQRLRAMLPQKGGGSGGQSVVHEGDTDSSDDESNRNPFEDKYNDFGRAVKRIARGHSSSSTGLSASREQLQEKAERVNKCARAQLSAASKRAKQPTGALSTAAIKTPDEFVMLDNFHRMYLINPRLSQAEMADCLREKRQLLISQLDKHVHGLSGGCGGGLEGGSAMTDTNWVTIGVVARKSDTRTSQKGSAYSSWLLTDLVDCQKPARLMLFNEAHSTLWKTSVGTVVAIAAAKVMKDREMNHSTSVLLSVNSSRNCMILGSSFDLGFCQSKCQNGRICMAFINKRQCSVCVHHMTAEYKKVSSKRTELQGCSGVTPKQRGLPAPSGGGLFNCSESSRPERGVKVSSQADKLRLASLGYQKASASAMTSRDRKLVVEGAHLSTEDKDVINSLATKNVQIGEFLMKPCAGARNMLRHMTQAVGNCPEPAVDGSYLNSTASGPPSAAPAPSGRQLLQAQAMLNKTPQLSARGRSSGGGGGEFVDLDVGTAVKRNVSRNMAINKQRALQLIRNRGKLQRQDLNQRRSKQTGSQRDAVRSRVLQAVSEDNRCRQLDTSDQDTADSTPGKRRLPDSDGTSENSDNHSQPASGDSKMARIRAAIVTKSAHSSALDAELTERQQTYFDTLEKKEMIEQKMLDTWQVKTKAIYCKQCKYRALSTSELCKTENHVCVAVDAVKRFFACKNCKNRTISLDKLPRFPCKNCGQDVWQRAPMGRERSGPKLENEVLSICGNDSKYVGSHVANRNINLEE